MTDRGEFKSDRVVDDGRLARPPEVDKHRVAIIVDKGIPAMQVAVNRSKPDMQLTSLLCVEGEPSDDSLSEEIVRGVFGTQRPKSDCCGGGVGVPVDAFCRNILMLATA